MHAAGAAVDQLEQLEITIGAGCLHQHFKRVWGRRCAHPNHAGLVFGAGNRRDGGMSCLDVDRKLVMSMSPGRIGMHGEASVESTCILTAYSVDSSPQLERKVRGSAMPCDASMLTEMHISKAG